MMPLTTPTLTWTDAKDGTGGTATVAGSTAGTTNTLQMMPIADWHDSGTTWTGQGSRTGDGAIAALPADWATVLPMGYYQARIQSAKAAETTVYSSEILISVTDRATYTYQLRVIRAVHARLLNIAALKSEASLPSAKIIVVPRIVFHLVEGVTGPCLVVGFGASKSEPGGDSATDDEAVPVEVAAFTRLGQRSALSEIDAPARWLEKAAKNLRSQSNLVGLEDEQFTSSISPLAVWDPLPPKHEVFFSAFTATFTGRLQRGTGT